MQTAYDEALVNVEACEKALQDAKASPGTTAERRATRRDTTGETPVFSNKAAVAAANQALKAATVAREEARKAKDTASTVDGYLKSLGFVSDMVDAPDADEDNEDGSDVDEDNADEDTADEDNADEGNAGGSDVDEDTGGPSTADTVALYTKITAKAIAEAEAGAKRIREHLQPTVTFSIQKVKETVPLNFAKREDLIKVFTSPPNLANFFSAN